MKVFTGILFVAIFIAFAYGEQCTTNANCQSTTCTAGSHVICEHPSGADGVVDNGGLCTCAQDNTGCTTRDDCLGANAPHLDCGDGRRHCYDQKCICSRWSPNGNQ